MVTLTCFGFDESDVRKLVAKAPRILEQKLASTLKAKLELLSTVGLNAKQVAKLMISCPMLFQLSVEKTLVPRMRFLEREFGPHDMRKIVSRYPSTLTMKVESRLAAVLGVLSGELGIPEETVRRKVVINPQIVASTDARNVHAPNACGPAVRCTLSMECTGTSSVPLGPTQPVWNKK